MKKGSLDGYPCFVPQKSGCGDPDPLSKKKFVSICGCFYLCVSCINIFFPIFHPDQILTCQFCHFLLTRDLFFPVVDGQSEEYERANNRVNKIFNHTRNQLDSLEKYNQYQDQKLEAAYNLYSKTNLKDVEAFLASFELNNRSTIAENNSNPQPMNKNAYILEEFKRVSKKKIQRERIVDRYYRSYVDEKGFAAETKALLAENSEKPIQTLVATEIKDARNYAYTPKAQQQQVNQAFQFPQPVLSDEELKKFRYNQSKKFHHGNPDYYNSSKEAGGWTSNMMVARCKENAFKCLFT